MEDHDHSNHKGHDMMAMMNGTGSPMVMQSANQMQHANGEMLQNGAHLTHADQEHDMKMYFHCTSEATILFSGWRTTSWETMLGSCIAIFIMSTLYEGLKVGREYLLRRAVYSTKYNAVPVPASAGDGGDVRVVQGNGGKPVIGRMLSLAHGIQTLLHLLQIIISYFLMLIFMTYNVYLCMAVAFGAMTGYFLFSWKRPIVIDINDHCH